MYVQVIDETLGGTFSGNVISAFLDLFATLRIGLQEPTKEDRFTSGVLSFYVRVCQIRLAHDSPFTRVRD
eukprot:scaffold3611_cov364-Prasinococcus_capsulatus_cf.AAC.7